MDFFKLISIMQIADKYLDSENFYINILFNDGECVDGYISSYGFAVLIYNVETKSYILFDTGGDGNVLLHNLNQAGIDVADISKVIISHNHLEHSKGLESVYNKNPKKETNMEKVNDFLIKMRKKYW